MNISIPIGVVSAGSFRQFSLGIHSRRLLVGRRQILCGIAVC